jgi:hypothetical protein
LFNNNKAVKTSATSTGTGIGGAIATQAFDSDASEDDNPVIFQPNS